MNENKPRTFYKTGQGLWIFSGEKEATIQKENSSFVLKKFVSEEVTSIEKYDVMAIARRNALAFISQQSSATHEQTR